MAHEDLLVTSAQATEIDRRSQEEFGIPAEVLMENAGRGCWRELLAYCRPAGDTSMVVVAGTGNNGGDALVLARHAHNAGFHRILVVHTTVKPNTLMALQFEICRKMGVETISWQKGSEKALSALREADLVVDGLAGTGLKGAHREVDLIDAINESPATRISIDVPSGAGSEFDHGFPAVHADLTVVTGYRKLFMYTPLVRTLCGEITQVDPGFPSRIAAEMDHRAKMWPTELWIPRLNDESHKGTRGRVACVGGAPGTSGAAVLAGTAALHARAGLVRVYADAETCRQSTASEPSLMTQAVDSLDGTVSAGLVEWADVVCLGPGLTSATRQEIKGVLRAAGKRGKAVVIDAAALRQIKPEDVPMGAVLTPHPGELAQLMGMETSDVLARPYQLLGSLVEQTGALVLLKGAVSILAAAETGGGRGRGGGAGASGKDKPSAARFEVQFEVFDGRLPFLGTGGTGDVLAGTIAGLLASCLDPVNAIRASVVANHRAATRLSEQIGYFTASQLSVAIGREVAAMENGRV